ncbi:MAG: Rieske 2Fe-2S domain-containing protein [Pseudomonadales bacterium]|nr:Rieske 2Fe-2S domain-containing protein [Pseudomonadales bacterium]
MEIDLEKNISIDNLKNKIDIGKINRPPKAWYYLGPVKSIKTTPTAFSPWGKPLIAYRNEKGIVAQYRHCIHMNTDLVKGTVVNGNITCPMHAWKFDKKGKCTDIPGGNHNECKLRLPSFPTHVVGGHAFVYKQTIKRGVTPPPIPFPAFQDLSWNEFEVGKGINFLSDSPWYLITANGFDICHFEFVHGRVPLRKSEIKFHSNSHCSIEHNYKNISQTWFDKLIRHVYGEKMSLNYNVFNGNMILSRTGMNGKSNYMCANVQPLDGERSKITIFPLTPKTIAIKQIPVLKHIGNFIRRVIIRQFFLAELRSIKSVRLLPENLMESDRVVTQYFHWLSTAMHKSTTKEETHEK